MADEYILVGFGQEADMATTTGAPQGGIVGEGAVLSGKVKGQNLSVLGTLEGEVTLSGRLSVGAQGKVAARVLAVEVVVEGAIEGDVRADSLTFAETAKAKGTFVAKRLVVKEGAVVEGAINPAGSSPEPAPPAPVPPAPFAAAPPAAATPGSSAAAPGTPRPTPPTGTPGDAK